MVHHLFSSRSNAVHCRWRSVVLNAYHVDAGSRYEGALRELSVGQIRLTMVNGRKGWSRQGRALLKAYQRLGDGAGGGVYRGGQAQEPMLPCRKTIPLALTRGRQDRQRGRARTLKRVLV